MRFRLLPAFLLLLLASVAFGSVATTTLDLRAGSGPYRNKVTQAASNSTENVLTFTLSPGTTRTVMLVCDADWKFRSTTGDSTTDLLVAANQVLIIELDTTATYYFVRSTADGTLKIVPLK